MSIHIQLKVASFRTPLDSDATVDVHSHFSYRSVGPSLEVSCLATKQARVNPVQCCILIGVCPWDPGIALVCET